MNHNNRQELLVPVSATASKKIALLKAHKKLAISHLSFITNAAITASAVNYVTIAVTKKSALGVDTVIATVDTQEAQAELAEKLLAAEIVLEKGELLYLNLTKGGTGTIEGLIDGDILVKGN